MRVEDARHLLIPDWPGNSRIDGLRNILRHPRVGLIFLIPAVRETLSVNGSATIHDEPELLDACAHDGRRPDCFAAEILRVGLLIAVPALSLMLPRLLGG